MINHIIIIIMKYTYTYFQYMAWIFEECKDTYGFCIRQYCALGVTFIVFLICSFSIVMTFRKISSDRFQYFPLLVNGIATFSLLCSLSQFEQENVYLIMSVIELYSYSILTYSFSGLYLLGVRRIIKQKFNKIKVGFIAFSILIIVSIILLILLQIFIKIKCNESHGIGNLVLFLLEIPLYVVTFILVAKTKKYIRKVQQKTHQQDRPSQIGLLGNQDQYVKVLYNQANLVIFSFTFSLIMHVITLVMFFIEKTSCSEGNYISTENIYEVLMFSLFDMATLIPHITTPIILYFIPAKYNRYGDTIILNNNSKIKQTEYDNNIIFSKISHEGIKDMVNNSPYKK